MLANDFIINKSGLDLVCYYEGLYLHAYLDSVGVATIGLGRIEYDDGTKVKLGDTCTQEQAEAWLMTDIEKDGSRYVRAYCKNWAQLTENQFSALASFTFNRGAGRLREGPAPFISSGDFPDAILSLLSFDWAGKEDNHLLGLARRRRSEAALFIGSDWERFKNWKPQ